jgi:glyoxylase-like metal-dependent hydrolase (beta-lactamase superfamily II)
VTISNDVRRPTHPEGIGLAEMPIGINHIESVNVYIIEDGDSVTLVDCGMWHPGEPDDGLTVLRGALHARGYILDDISRIFITHAHIDHYGMAGRLMELTGAELLMHAMTDLDCEKYRHPETAQARKRDTYSDHGVAPADLPAFSDTLVKWMPYLHSVVEASTRLQGGEAITIGTRDWEILHTPGHSLGHICLWSPQDKLLFSGDHLLPAVTPPVTFERGFDPDPLRSYLASLKLVAERDPALVMPGHGRAFADGRRRVDAITRNKQRRLDAIHATIRNRPCTVREIADVHVAKAFLQFQRNLAMAETLAHLAYLRWQGLIERRLRSDGVYEWYSTDDADAR